MRSPRERVRANRLREPRRLAIDHRPRRLGRDVARSESRASRCQYEQHSVVHELAHGTGDEWSVVRDDTPDDVEALVLEEPLEDVAARVVALAGAHSVGHREHGSRHMGSLLFDSRRTPSTTISLSTAFAMS